MFSSVPFGSATTFGTSNPSPFGGGSLFGTQNSGSTSLFGASSSSPAGSGSTSSGFGGSSSPSFGSPSVFGQKPGFGSSFGTNTASSAFGSQPAFGVSSASNTTGMFGSTTASNSPMLGSTASNATGMFGSTNTGVFGSTTSNPITGFGVPSYPMLSSTASNTSGTGFTFSSSPTFGSTTSNLGGSSFGTLNTPSTGFSLGSTTSNTSGATTSGFTGLMSFGANQGGSRAVRYAPIKITDDGKVRTVKSISGMGAYEAKSHEELRWEDYQRRDKGGPAQTTGLGFHNRSSSPSPFSPTTIAPPQHTSSGFASLSNTVSVSPFTITPWSGFNTQSSPLSQSTTSIWGQNSSTSNSPTLNSSTSGQNSLQTSPWTSTTPSPTNMQPPQTNPWPSTMNLQPPQVQTQNLWTSSQTTQPPQTQTQTQTESPGFEKIGEAVSSPGDQNILFPVNPFGTEVSRNQQSYAPPVEYHRGIRNLPVLEKPAPVVRITSSLTARHISQRRMKMPERKQQPGGDKRVPFFGDQPVFLARENPRAWLASRRFSSPEDESRRFQ